MFKKILALTAITSLTLFMLAGCASVQNNKKSDSTISMSSTKNNDSSESSQVVTSSSTKTQTQSSTQQTAVASTNTSSSETVEANDNAASYGVDVTQFATPVTFNLKGMNVPTAITIATNKTTTTITFDATKNQYEANVTTIPTKEIRVFSHTDNSIRTVKVNTQLTLAKGSGQYLNDTLYLIANNQGGLSLLTPNYAGNVANKQQDVMLEAIN